MSPLQDGVDRNAMRDMLDFQRLKNVVCAIGFLVAGTIIGIVTKSWASFAAGALVAGYFVFELVELYFNQKSDKYVHVTAMAVSSDVSKGLTGYIETWRFVPVDDNGNVLDENGSKDIFLNVPRTLKNSTSYHVGATYNMLFCMDAGAELNQESLVSIEKKNPKVDPAPAKVGKTVSNRQDMSENDEEKSRKGNVVKIDFRKGAKREDEDGDK